MTRKELQDAIDRFEAWAAASPIGEEVRLIRAEGALPGKNYGPATEAILAAARAHLASLPKTVKKWQVDAIVNHTGEDAGYYPYDKQEDAVDFAKTLLDDLGIYHGVGIRMIEVEE